MNVAQASTLTRKALQTRRAIINAARRLIGIDGVDGVTIVSVCDAANVGRTSFYNYFEDTRSLLETLASDVSLEVQAEFEAMHGGLERGLERLERCLLMLFQKASSDPELGLLITALAQRYPAFLQILEEQISNELEAAFENRELDLPELEREAGLDFLVIAVLAVMRKFALGQIDPSSADVYVRFIMRAIKRPA